MTHYYTVNLSTQGVSIQRNIDCLLKLGHLKEVPRWMCAASSREDDPYLVDGELTSSYEARSPE